MAKIPPYTETQGPPVLAATRAPLTLGKSPSVEADPRITTRAARDVSQGLLTGARALGGMARAQFQIAGAYEQIGEAGQRLADMGQRLIDHTQKAELHHNTAQYNAELNQLTQQYLERSDLTEIGDDGRAVAETKFQEDLQKLREKYSSGLFGPYRGRFNSDATLMDSQKLVVLQKAIRAKVKDEYLAGVAEKVNAFAQIASQQDDMRRRQSFFEKADAVINQAVRDGYLDHTKALAMSLKMRQDAAYSSALRLAQVNPSQFLEAAASPESAAKHFPHLIEAKRVILLNYARRQQKGLRAEFERKEFQAVVNFYAERFDLTDPGQVSVAAKHWKENRDQEFGSMLSPVAKLQISSWFKKQMNVAKAGAVDRAKLLMKQFEEPFYAALNKRDTALAYDTIQRYRAAGGSEKVISQWKAKVLQIDQKTPPTSWNHWLYNLERGLYKTRGIAEQEAQRLLAPDKYEAYKKKIEDHFSGRIKSDYLRDLVTGIKREGILTLSQLHGELLPMIRKVLREALTKGEITSYGDAKASKLIKETYETYMGTQKWGHSAEKKKWSDLGRSARERKPVLKILDQWWVAPDATPEEVRQAKKVLRAYLKEYEFGGFWAPSLAPADRTSQKTFEAQMQDPLLQLIALQAIRLNLTPGKQYVPLPYGIEALVIEYDYEAVSKALIALRKAQLENRDIRPVHEADLRKIIEQNLGEGPGAPVVRRRVPEAP